MLKPPAMPATVCLAGKISVGLAWLFGFYGLLLADAASSLSTIGTVTLLFLAGSHVVETFIYAPFLKAARATPVDYVQVFLFGLFHSSTLKIAA
jgi:uncharacterized protein YhhL (DUF1145 family)